MFNGMTHVFQPDGLYSTALFLVQLSTDIQLDHRVCPDSVQ